MRPARIATLVMLSLLVAASLRAEDGRIEIGIRANAMHANSPLTDQIIGAGVMWRYHVRQDWFVAFSLDTYEYDIEQPLALMGAVQAPDRIISPLQVRTIVFATALGQSRALRDTGFDWFWHAGIGLGIPNVPSASGVTQRGRAYDLHTQAGTEIHLSAALGTAYYFSPQWALIGAGRLEHQFIDLQISDKFSGETLTVESMSPIGVFVSLNYRF